MCVCVCVGAGWGSNAPQGRGIQVCRKVHSSQPGLQFTAHNYSCVSPPPHHEHPHNPPSLKQLAFELLGQMRGEGLAPSAVTYGCLLAACERSGDVERAFALYKQACDEVRFLSFPWLVCLFCRACLRSLSR